MNQKEIMKWLMYDDLTGKLHWIKRPGRRVQIFDEAGCLNNNGYLITQLNGKQYKNHRLIWLIKTGDWPVHQIDHIDHDKANNLFANLRDVTHSGNQRNANRSSRNTSGVAGVFFSKTALSKPWKAAIHGGTGNKIHLGYFATKEEAASRRKIAEQEYGYHENHGRRDYK